MKCSFIQATSITFEIECLAFLVKIKEKLKHFAFCSNLSYCRFIKLNLKYA